MSSPLAKIIATKGWCVADGATGTNLFWRGLVTGFPPELWSVERPDDILWLHNSFINAGSDLILTNSLSGNGCRLKLHDGQDRVAELNEVAAKLARQAADAHTDSTGRQVVVAGSIGATGELFAPLGALTETSAVAAFHEQASALAKGGVDVLWIETMSSNKEVVAAIEAVKTIGLAICSAMTFDTASRSMMGVTPADFTSFAAARGADFIGVNCGIGPAELLHSVRVILTQANNTPVVAKGNCGIPAYADGAIHYHGAPKLMAEYALFARDASAKIIGECCGTSLAHVAAMVTALNGTAKRPFDPAAMTSPLGTAWDGVNIIGGGNAPRGGRRCRRH